MRLETPEDVKRFQSIIYKYCDNLIAGCIKSSITNGSKGIKFDEKKYLENAKLHDWESYNKICDLMWNSVIYVYSFLDYTVSEYITPPNNYKIVTRKNQIPVALYSNVEQFKVTLTQTSRFTYVEKNNNIEEQKDTKDKKINMVLNTQLKQLFQLLKYNLYIWNSKCQDESNPHNGVVCKICGYDRNWMEHYL